uniref:Retrovirus-related Pol polyprotein from transposon TNT 1-94 n=1 Tax=Tanacetum cinerariifolium TaxID=118510 RepID=A0A6L2P664_TANCI|nr:retrovirus-related Pol polyprotein from transposon TNT 1-94 [Tanacetum cinerariifolium]
MTTPITTFITDSQMHYNIMTVGSRDRPPMLAMERYAQWQSRFLRYIDTRPNGDALRKCILEGPYQPTTNTITAVPARENSPAIPERTTVETILTMSHEIKAYYKSKKEAIHLLLTGIGDEIYSTVDTCKTAHEMWIAIERLQQGESLNIQDVKTNLFWEFENFTSHDGEFMESYYFRFYKMMNEMIRNNLAVTTMQVKVQFLQQLQPEWSSEIRAERIAKNANPLALVAAASQYPDPYYQAPKSHKLFAPSSKQAFSTRSNASTKFKGKEIAKPITPLSESASKEDNDPEQAQRDKDMQKKLALIAKYLKRSKNLPTTNSEPLQTPKTRIWILLQECRKPNRVKDSTYHKEKMLLYKQAEKGVPLQAEQADWLEDMDEEIDEQELEAHYSTNDVEYNVFANVRQHFEQPESTSYTCLVEKDDSNVTPDSPNILVPDREETLTLEKKSRSKLNKDLVRPYDYTKLNSLYENFKPASQEYHEQLAHTNEAWEKHSHNHFRALTALDMEVLIKTCLMPLAIKTHNDSFTFVHELKQEMHVDLKAHQLPQTSKNTNPRVSTSTRVIHNTNVSRPQLRSTQMKDKVVPNNSQVKNKKTEVEDHPRISSISNKTKSVTECNDSLKSKTSNVNVIVQLILFIADSGCTKHMMGNLTLLCDFVEKYMGTVRFGNDQFAPILGYGDLVQGNITINMVYYVEGLNHNLFSVGQFCDADLEVAFRKSTCFVRDLQGNDLLTGNCGSDIYTISLQETTSSTLICLLAKASPTQAWLWHRRLSHLKFDYINLLSKKDVMIGLPKLKYVKDQLCSSCEVSKAKRSSFKTKAVPSLKGWLNLLHMDLCGPMRVVSINEKKYILASDYENSSPAPQLQNVFPIADTTVLSQQELDLLFGHLYDEFFNAGTSSVNKSSSPTDNSAQQDTQPLTNIHPTTEPTTSTNVNAEENNKNQAVDTLFQQDEFINPFCTPIREVPERKFMLHNPIDRDHPEKVYRLRKALYGLKQALRAWTSDPPILRGIFINQAKYALEILKKHGMEKCQIIGTPMATKPKLDVDLSGKLVEQNDYHSKIRCHQGRLLPHARDLGFKPRRGGFLSGAKKEWGLSPKTKHDGNGTLCDLSTQNRKEAVKLGSDRTEYQLADMFTKALPEDKFQYLVRRIGMRCLTPAELEVLANEYA